MGQVSLAFDLRKTHRFDGWRQYFGSRSHTITANTRGHFVTTAHIDGIAIKLLIDTGATSVVLSRDDAHRLGIQARSLDFSVLFSTAGGVARAAPVTLDEIQVGDFAVSNVRAFVIDTPSTISVLGMDFLSRLERYEVTGSKLNLALVQTSVFALVREGVRWLGLMSSLGSRAAAALERRAEAGGRCGGVCARGGGFGGGAASRSLYQPDLSVASGVGRRAGRVRRGDRGTGR